MTNCPSQIKISLNLILDLKRYFILKLKFKFWSSTWIVLDVISIPPFIRFPDCPITFRYPWPISPFKIIVSFVARLSSEKRPLMFVEIAKNLLDILDDDVISLKTGLDVEVVRKLRAEK